MINEAVVPLHPMVPNPYTVLREISEQAKYFSVIDLKDASYCVPLAEEGRFLFAFEDLTQPASQLTWTVLSQGFCDSPSYLGCLSWDLQYFNSSEAVVLQYVDDILLCAETEEACSIASEGFLNFLAGCGYKASREKAQLCQQSVRYLGLIVSEGTRAIGPERIKPILNHPLPMTLRQLRGFGGITGYCCIGFQVMGNLPGLCMNLELRLSRPKPTDWFGLQILKRLLRFFRLLSCKLPL